MVFRTGLVPAPRVLESDGSHERGHHHPVHGVRSWWTPVPTDRRGFPILVRRTRRRSPAAHRAPAAAQPRDPRCRDHFPVPVAPSSRRRRIPPPDLGQGPWRVLVPSEDHEELDSLLEAIITEQSTFDARHGNCDAPRPPSCATLLGLFLLFAFRAPQAFRGPMIDGHRDAP